MFGLLLVAVVVFYLTYVIMLWRSWNGCENADGPSGEAALREEIADLNNQLRAMGVRRLPRNGWTQQMETFDSLRCRIPRILHQTWKSRTIGATKVKYVRSWIDLNPDWHYKLWTDKDNRLLVASRFPQYLDLYDSYPQDIMRADIIRYLILYEFGGVYADTDFEALRPLDDLLNETSTWNGREDIFKTSSSRTVRHMSCILGQEPYEHAWGLYRTKHLICNAIMLSCPGYVLRRPRLSLSLSSVTFSTSRRVRMCVLTVTVAPRAGILFG